MQKKQTFWNGYEALLQRMVRENGCSFDRNDKWKNKKKQKTTKFIFIKLLMANKKYWYPKKNTRAVIKNNYDKNGIYSKRDTKEGIKGEEDEIGKWEVEKSGKRETVKKEAYEKHAHNVLFLRNIMY